MSKTALLGVLGILAVLCLPMVWPPESLGEGAMALAMIASSATVTYGARNFPTPNRAPTSAELRAAPPGPTRPIPCASDEDED